VDLHFLDARPTEEERAAIDGLLGPAPASNGRMAESGRPSPERRALLLPALHAVNDRVGWVSPGALNLVAERLSVPPAEVYGVLTFYALLSPTPRLRRQLHVCTDLVCLAHGAEEMAGGLGPEGEAAAGHVATWHRSPCLGVCERAPAAMVVEAGVTAKTRVVAPVDAEAAQDLLAGKGSAIGEAPPEASVRQAGDPSLVLLRRVGAVDPSSLSDYRAAGGYRALRTAIELGPVGIVREIVDSKLLGRGGAAFPAGRKWDAVSRQPVRPHYLVCNADESEPGTFKDRVLMEGDPFAVVEAMTIAAFATGCEQGYVYLRGEYPRARTRLDHAIAEARRQGLLGDDVMGAGFRFDIELFRGAGAYICGEETAIFNSIEGRRGEPRNKPPFPVDVGLFGKPTLVNNVETLVNVLPILESGGLAYAAIGTEASTGTKLFCVSGRVQRSGVYEVPFGTTLSELLVMAGGVPDGHELRAVLLGGAAGTFVRPDALDLPLTFEGTRAAGASLGSGVVMLLDDTVELVPFLLRIAAFFRDESCGQCVPCRVGTVRQEEALRRLARGGAGPGRVGADPAGDLALLADLSRVMRDASICGLGQTASSAVDSALAQLGVFS
jgi:NADH-quinone oxidoreductase subunit F